MADEDIDLTGMDCEVALRLTHQLVAVGRRCRPCVVTGCQLEIGGVRDDMGPTGAFYGHGCPTCRVDHHYRRAEPTAPCRQLSCPMATVTGSSWW